jgi:hypothetical protein
MKSFIPALCLALSLASASALPVSPASACPGDGSEVVETCTVTPSFYLKNGEEQYYLHFSSRCSRPVQVTGTYDGAPFGVYIGANSTGEVAIGRRRPDPARLSWGFEIK